jgi:type IV pilus assembly protein PilV
MLMSKKLQETGWVAQRGTILLEVLVSVLILALGVLSIVGLQAAAIRNTTEAKLRSDASFIANRTISRMWGDPDDLAVFVEDNAELPVEENLVDDKIILPAGKRTVAVNGRRVTVTITWQVPGGELSNVQMVAHINE